MKEQSSWLYYEEVDAAVDTLIALVETTGGLSLAYVEALNVIANIKADHLGGRRSPES